MENGKDTLQITTKKPLKSGFHFLQKIFMTVRQFSKYSYVFEMLSKIDILCRHDKTNSRRALQIQTLSITLFSMLTNVAAGCNRIHWQYFKKAIKSSRQAS